MIPSFRSKLCAIALLLTGCSPKIYTNLRQTLPPRAPEAPVLIYDQNAVTPASAEVVGAVTIKDSGFTTDCNYDRVIGLAKAETNKAGGNALHLTWWKKPSLLGSSCHQIAGDMLRIPDSLYTMICASPTEPWPTSTTVQSDNNVTITANTTAVTPSTGKRALHHLYVEGGYGFIYSKLKTGDLLQENPRSGLTINAGYQIFSHSGYGGGIRYSGYFASSRLTTQPTTYQLRLHYIAPEFAMQQRFTRWDLRESFGVGYAIYAERLANESGSIGGFGMHLTLGAAYHIHPNIALGIEIGDYMARFSTLDEIVGESFNSSKMKAGFNRIAITAGIHFNF